MVIIGTLSQKQTSLVLAQTNREFQSEKDGFGFMASNGKTLARGRYLSPNRFAGYMSNLPRWLRGEQSEENKLPIGINSLVIHGRTSTNHVSLGNVHPFLHKGVYLAHNGIVSWQGKGTQPKPSCDSNQFLHWLLEGGSWDKATEAFSGWGSIALHDSKTAITTIARNHASLFIARRVKDNGWIIATKESHIKSVCAKANIGLSTGILEFPDNLIVQFKDGKAIADSKWQGFGTRVWSVLDDKAKGINASVNARTERRNRKTYAKYWESIKPSVTVTPEQEHKAMFPDWDKAVL